MERLTLVFFASEKTVEILSGRMLRPCCFSPVLPAAIGSVRMKHAGRLFVRSTASGLAGLWLACASAHAAGFAASVADYAPGTGWPLDSLTGQSFTNPAAALGPPTADTTGDGFAVSPLAPLPVTPVYPAFRSFELVSLGLGGRLTLAFDHPVLDDPANPFGIDLLVFGNEWHSAPGASAATTLDPATVTLTSTLVKEPGVVSVSADGSNWFTYAAGPFADGALPTLGRRLDPGAPDAALGSWNAWWGAPTDPALPVDPALTPSDLAGESLAFAARAYGGSAGGAGFDLAAFDLPLDPASGRKYVRYVRIENLSATWTPEIDAVADVEPVSAWRQFQLTRFAWRDRMDPAAIAPHADPDRDGVPNLLEHGADTLPLVADAQPLFSVSMLSSIETGTQVLVEYRVRMQAEDLTLLVEQAADLHAWSTNGVVQAHHPPRLEDGWRIHTAAVPAGTCGAVRLRAELSVP